MTRPARSSLVLDGNTIKLRLQAERSASESMVHVDWVRFTVLLRNAPIVTVDQIFPQPSNVWDDDYRAHVMGKVLAEIPDPDFAASAQAWSMAQQVAQAIGPQFVPVEEVRKGHDFYRCRYSIELNGTEVAWIGFLASSDSPRQHAQAQTIHVNVQGAACTFAAEGWRYRLADLVDQHKGTLTRVDQALDMFDGMPGGIERTVSDFLAGLMNVHGKQPKFREQGGITMKEERSYYIGSREAGKQTNVYEKGHQLFGVKTADPWVRAELRWGNKLRELPTDMLRRPDDFFAGASDWHAQLLAECHGQATAENAPCRPRLPEQTILAEVTRNLSWAINTAAATISVAFQHMGDDFLQLVEHQKLPGRLRRFTTGQIAQAFQQLNSRRDHGPTLTPALA